MSSQLHVIRAARRQSEAFIFCLCPVLTLAQTIERSLVKSKLTSQSCLMYNVGLHVFCFFSHYFSVFLVLLVCRFFLFWWPRFSTRVRFRALWFWNEAKYLKSKSALELGSADHSPVLLSPPQIWHRPLWKLWEIDGPKLHYVGQLIRH